jgi:hypothetical protein
MARGFAACINSRVLRQSLQVLERAVAPHTPPPASPPAAHAPPLPEADPAGQLQTAGSRRQQPGAWAGGGGGIRTSTQQSEAVLADGLEGSAAQALACTLFRGRLTPSSNPPVKPGTKGSKKMRCAEGASPSEPSWRCSERSQLSLRGGKGACMGAVVQRRRARGRAGQDSGCWRQQPDTRQPLKLAGQCSLKVLARALQAAACTGHASLQGLNGRALPAAGRVGSYAQLGGARNLHRWQELAASVQIRTSRPNAAQSHTLPAG